MASALNELPASSQVRASLSPMAEACLLHQNFGPTLIALDQGLRGIRFLTPLTRQSHGICRNWGIDLKMEKLRCTLLTILVAHRYDAT